MQVCVILMVFVFVSAVLIDATTLALGTITVAPTLTTDINSANTVATPPGPIYESEVGVATRGEWMETNWTLDTGPPSMTKVHTGRFRRYL